MESLPYSERTWVIQHYLNGTLPDDLHKQVEERRLSDPDFDRQVLAQGLLAMYAESERNTLEFYAQTEALTIESGKTRASYNTSKVIHTLPELIRLHPLLWASAAVIALVFIWTIVNLAPEKQPKPESIIIQLDEFSDYAATEPNVWMLRYKQLPGWQGLWQRDNQYRWPGDTLFLYGKDVRNIPLDSLQLSILDSTHYRLQVGQRRFRLRKGQLQNQPLESDETP